MRRLRSILMKLIFLASVSQLHGQFPGAQDNPFGGNQPSFQDTFGLNASGPDTTIYDIFSMYDVDVKVPFADTTLNQFHLYDPVRKGKIYGAQLGNLGSSARPLLYDVPYQRGVNFGYDNYNYYRLNREDVKWYSTNRPFSDFYFSPGSSQQNFIVKAKFSRNFADSVSFHLDYQRISQEGFYTNQQTKQTFLSSGLRIQRDKTDTYILGMFNANNEEHNGGIIDKTLFNLPNFNFRQRIPIAIDGGNTRYNNVDISVNNYYHLTDSLSNKIGISFRHEFAIDGGAFKFFDDLNFTNTQNYAPFGTDDRGIRNRTGFFNLESGLYAQIKNETIKFQAGIVYDFFNIKQEPRIYKKNNLFLRGNGSLTILNEAQLDFKGHLGLADNAGDLWLEGNLNLDLSTIGTIRGGLKIYRYEPTILQQEVYFNNEAFWNNAFPKVNGTGFFVTYFNSKLGLEATLSADAIDNAIFFGPDKFPTLKEGAFTSSRLLVTEKLKLGPIHFHNTIGLQTFNDNIYNLPRWLSEHNIFIEGKIFKERMLARFGFDMRLMESYFPAAFSPEIGMFYQQNEIQENLFKILDGYISFKISRFRLFTRFENLTHFIFTGNNDINYQVPNYPQFDFKFRLGAAWQIKD